MFAPLHWLGLLVHGCRACSEACKAEHILLACIGCDYACSRLCMAVSSQIGSALICKLLSCVFVEFQHLCLHCQKAVCTSSDEFQHSVCIVRRPSGPALNSITLAVPCDHGLAGCLSVVILVEWCMSRPPSEISYYCWHTEGLYVMLVALLLDWAKCLNKVPWRICLTGTAACGDSLSQAVICIRLWKLTALFSLVEQAGAVWSIHTAWDLGACSTVLSVIAERGRGAPCASACTAGRFASCAASWICWYQQLRCFFSVGGIDSRHRLSPRWLQRMCCSPVVAPL